MKKIFTFIILFLGSLLVAGQAQAVCPVCTVAVAAGLGLSRYFGIDDTISGLWIGGLLMSLTIWTIDWLNRKNIRFYGRKITVFAAYYLLVAAPLYWYDIVGHPLNKFWGIDKLMLGIIIGTIFFTAGNLTYEYLKKKNGDRAHFPFQKIIMPVSPLIILSIIFYFLTK